MFPFDFISNGFVLSMIVTAFVSGSAALYANMIILSNRKTRPDRWRIAQAVNITIFALFLVTIIIIHIIAFFHVSQSELQSQVVDIYGQQSTPITILNWPIRYSGIQASWPYPELITFDALILAAATGMILIIAPFVYFMSRKSKRREVIIKSSIFIVIAIIIADMLAGTSYALLFQNPDGRTIIITSFIIFFITITILVFTLWRPFYRRLLAGPSKSFSERMRELNNDFAQVSVSADSILEEMNQVIANREQEVKSREERVGLIEQRIDVLTKQETEQQKRVELVKNEPKEVITAITEYINGQLDPNLDRREREDKKFSIVLGVICAILGLALGQILHLLHLFGF